MSTRRSTIKGEPTEAWLSGLGTSPEEAAESVEKRIGKLAKRFGTPAAPPTVIPYLQLSAEDREKVVGPATDERGTLTEPRAFNLMFKTFVGALESESNVAYLRPETAQGIFANFKNVVDTGRVKTPVRHRPDRQELPQRDQPAELHVPLARVRADGDRVLLPPRGGGRTGTRTGATPGSSGTSTWACESDRLRLRDHDPDELAFYSTATADIEYAFPFGISELEGIAHRGDYDLKQHQKFSGKDLSYFDEEKKERYRAARHRALGRADRGDPGVPLRGVYRGRGRRRDADRAEVPPQARAGQGGGLPAGQAGRHARDGREDLSRPEAAFNVFYDEKGAIGRRYRRQDEAGTPFCITVDGQTLTDGTVTFRDRDTCRQWRVPGDGVAQAAPTTCCKASRSRRLRDPSDAGSSPAAPETTGGRPCLIVGRSTLRRSRPVHGHDS